MRCLYCDKKINKITIQSILLEEDMLCVECRKSLKVNKKYVYIDELKVETLYNYDEGLFKDFLIQYKECFDEALAPIFLYLLKDYIRYKYFGYKLLFVPSRKEKIESRGFNHLEKVFESLKMPIIYGLSMKQELAQEGKNLSDRRSMIDNYTYSGKPLNKVLIVDDVITSGSSIKGIYKAIKPHACSVRALTLARKENAFIK